MLVALILTVVLAVVGLLMGLVALVQAQRTRLELQRLKGRLRRRRSSGREEEFPRQDSFPGP